MRWLKVLLPLIGVACLGERPAMAQFYDPYYQGGFGSFGRTIGFNISFGGGGYGAYGYGGYGYGGYGYDLDYYQPYPIYRESYYLSPPPIYVVQQPRVIVIERPPSFKLQEQPKADPGPIPPIGANVKPANLLVIRPDKQPLPAPRAVPDDEQLKQAEAELEAARQRLNAMLRAKAKGK